MRFIYKGSCECGGELIFLATGEAEFDPAECSLCKKAAFLLDPLSVGYVVHPSKLDTWGHI